MDIFRKAKSVRMISHRDKYLIAGEDRETVIQDDAKTANDATIWAVELVEGKDAIRLISCFGTYLTASSAPFLPGVTARKVVQTAPYYCDPATQWAPERDGMQVKLRSFWGNFLRPNGGLPPWRNAITHDLYHRPKSKEKLLWDVEVVERWPANQAEEDSNRDGDGRFCRSRSRSFSASMASAQKQVVIRAQEFI